MYAIVRQYEYDASRRAELVPALDEVRTLHEEQPGYAGSLVIEDGHRLIAVNLWESEHDADAGRAAIGPPVQRLLAPLSAGRSELIAAGPVIDGNPRSQPARGAAAH